MNQHLWSWIVPSAKEVRTLLEQVRRALGDGKALADVVSNTSSTIKLISEQLPELLSRARNTLAAIEDLSTRANAATGENALKEIVADARRTTKRLDEISRDTQSMLRKIRRGEGTVGGFVNDSQVYDDVKEMLRDLKKHPWKFLWRD